jgi:hypothetical protein
MPMRGAITPGANIAQAISICSAVMATSAGAIGTDFVSGVMRGWCGVLRHHPRKRMIQ